MITPIALYVFFPFLVKKFCLTYCFCWFPIVFCILSLDGPACRHGQLSPSSHCYLALSPLVVLEILNHIEPCLSTCMYIYVYIHILWMEAILHQLVTRSTAFRRPWGFCDQRGVLDHVWSARASRNLFDVSLKAVNPLFCCSFSRRN